MTEDPLEPLRSRRRYLRSAGVVGLGLLPGCSSVPDTETRTTAATSTPTGTPSTTREPTRTATPERYERVVNVVEAGADPEGGQSVTPVLEEVADDDTLVHFPPGTYLFESVWRFDGYSNLGVVGDRATLVPGEDLRYWLIALDVSDFTLAGFTLDHRGEGVGPQVQVHTTAGHSVVRDLTVRGFHDSDYITFTPYVEDEDASMLVERLRVPDGTKGVPAVYLGPESVGKITFADCYLEHCAQGIYGSAHSGPFNVLGGVYANNNKAAIRVGAGDHGAHIRGVHVRVDDPLSNTWTNGMNIRGIWMREGDGTFVTDCDFEMMNLEGILSDGAIVLGDLMGRATIRNTRIRMDASAYAVRAQHPSSRTEKLQGNQGLPDEHHLTCENLRIVGGASDLEAIRVMGRDDSTFRNISVTQPNGRRRGLVIGSNSKNCTVEGGTWVTGHYPLVVEANRQALMEGACPVRLEDVTRLDAVNLDDAGERIAMAKDGSYCIDGVAGLEDATDVVIAVLGVRDGVLFGRRMSTSAFRRRYGN